MTRHRPTPTPFAMLSAAAATVAMTFVPYDAGADAAEDATRQLTRAVGSMRFVRGLDQVPLLTRTLTRAETRVAQCRSALAAARAAGVTADTEIDLQNNRHVPGARSVRMGRGFITVGKVGNIAPYCSGIARDVVAARTGLFVRHAKDRTQRLRSRGAKSPELILEVRRAGDLCRRRVTEALAKGAPADGRIPLLSGHITFAAARAQVCDVATADATRAAAAMNKERTEDHTTYRRALRGDRWRVYSDNLLYGAKVHTIISGEREALENAAGFAKATVWFETYDNSVLGREWVVRRYAFKGDRLDNIQVLRGTGRRPAALSWK